MMNYVNAAFGWLWRKKLFFAAMILSALLFFAMIFPFSDLSDAVTSQIAMGTNNQVYVQFETLDLSVLPAPAATATGVQADLMNFPTLSIGFLKLRPAWFSILFSPLQVVKAIRGDADAQKYMGFLAASHVRADEVLGGDVSLDLKGSTGVDLEIDQLNLAKAQEWAKFPLKMEGRASAGMTLKVDPSLREQPEGDFNLKVVKFVLPTGTLMTQMGPITLPTISMKNVSFRGRMVGGNLILEDGTFGQAGEPAFGRIKGQLALRLMSVNGQIVPMPGTYNLTVDLNMTPAFEKELGIAFLLESYKTPGAAANRYLVRVQGSDFANPPAITRVSSF